MRQRNSLCAKDSTLLGTLLIVVFFFCAAKKDVEALLKASGVTADAESLTVMMKKLEGKSVPDLIKEGTKDLASMPAAGAAPAGGAAAATADAAPAKKEEKEVEEEVDMGGMFGDDDDY